MEKLNTDYLNSIKLKVESKILPAMENIYGSGSSTIPDTFYPHLKYFERIVSYYDYCACGISVLAPLSVRGNKRADRIIGYLLKNMEHYRTRIYGHAMQDAAGPWTVPLRRLLFHASLAYEVLGASLKPSDRNGFKKLLEQQTRVALEHNNHFHPGEKRLYLGFMNNHTAIFMQGVFHVGRLLGNKQWMMSAKEAAGRLFRSGHSDGYWEENTNTRREGGPSMIYTPLTAGCLYDILDGFNKKQPAFLSAGKLYRGFLNYDGRAIPLADERTNCHSKISMYGLALHSLTAEGRGYIRHVIDNMDWNDLSPENLAVLYYELSQMHTGACKTPEYRKPGIFRISLPLGVLRYNGWTAGLSALRALNRVRSPGSDYALDHQNMAYLSHDKGGIILTGYKSKHDPEYSTFSRGVDAYPIDTGVLKMGKNWASVQLHYATFDATLRWDLGKTARLTLETNDSREIITTLPINGVVSFKSSIPASRVKLKGFSPYSAGNAEKPETALRFAWRKRLVVEFKGPDKRRPLTTVP
ncbi:MAG: hypothetical protein JNL74_10365 [Fibrobacteres bacterium]|nr:hypothetical protein [Fibrobacterota bacterium]